MFEIISKLYLKPFSVEKNYDQKSVRKNWALLNGLYGVLFA